MKRCVILEKTLAAAGLSAAQDHDVGLFLTLLPANIGYEISCMALEIFI